MKTLKDKGVKVSGGAQGRLSPRGAHPVPAVGHRLLLHLVHVPPGAGQRQQGLLLRQEQGQALPGLEQADHLRRRGRPGRGQVRAAGSRGVPQEPAEVRPARRQDPQGRAPRRHARARARPCSPRPSRGRRTSLSSTCRARISSRCSSASAPAASATSSSRAGGTRPASCSSTSWTPWAAPAAPATAAATTSASRPSTRCSWRWTASTPRTASSSWRPPTGPTSWIPPSCGPGRFDRQVVVDMPDIRERELILRLHAKKLPLAENVDLGAPRPRHARLLRRGPRQPGERGGAVRRPQEQGPRGHGRLRGGARQDPHGRRAQEQGHPAARKSRWWPSTRPATGCCTTT